MTSPGRSSVRDAVEADWPAIWPFFRRPSLDGESYAFPLDLTRSPVGGSWLEPPPGRCVVAVDADGAVLGSAKMGPNRPGRGSHVGTASFMVAPAARGRGVGRLLAVETVDWLRRSGFAASSSTRWSRRTPRPCALWRSLGFEVVGTVPQAFDSRRHGLVGLHVMYLTAALRAPQSTGWLVVPSSTGSLRGSPGCRPGP